MTYTHTRPGRRVGFYYTRTNYIINTRIYSCLYADITNRSSIIHSPTSRTPSGSRSDAAEPLHFSSCIRVLLRTRKRPPVHNNLVLNGEIRKPSAYRVFYVNCKNIQNKHCDKSSWYIVTTILPSTSVAFYYFIGSRCVFIDVLSTRDSRALSVLVSKHVEVSREVYRTMIFRRNKYV